MCGITGIVSFSEQGKSFHDSIDKAVSALSKRGPDSYGTFRDKNVSLGHTRLSIIDTSSASSQPFTDPTGRFTIVYNGEFYNYASIKDELQNDGVQFITTGDTEVLLQLYIKLKEKSLEKINGFFAFAVYDKEDESVFIARDRFGIKPLLYLQDEDKLIFGSEMKALLSYNISKEIDFESLHSYLELNYIPAPHSIFKNVKKLLPGHFLKITEQVESECYYEIPAPNTYSSHTYNEAKKQTLEILEKSVQRRLVSDVPLGTFLSGGIDSSIITALASKHHNKINTFSIGFKDNKMFDETFYSRLVAKKFNTNHTEFALSTDELHESLHSTLDYLDEPFADSSALAVNLLSKYTRQHVTVALSGDGADELFSGYNKHKAEYEVRNPGFMANAIRKSSFIWENIPQSRSNKIGNISRQLHRFRDGINLSAKERYWNWAKFNDISSQNILNHTLEKDILDKRKETLLKDIKNEGDFNDILRSDMHLVLPNDMLHKVDMMSMANSLEVRTPFLDHELVDYVFNLTPDFKINRKIKKKLLQDTFQSILPSELYDRPKKGFEVPLLSCFKTELKSLINDELLEDSFVKEQNIFNPSKIKELKSRLFSNSPGAIESQIWGLIVFQTWWKKWMA
ncbi:MAG: asparagine synthase (glutamine-hydrolyzing) [Flavobacteriales bacterium]|nr:asparagine synthase (glutamine-hydrolyzing) [Flavobacteriales bacterium]